jgi:hypothetical protein
MQYPLNAELLGIIRQWVHSELLGLANRRLAPTVATIGNNDFLGHAVLQLAETRTTMGATSVTSPVEFCRVNLQGLMWIQQLDDTSRLRDLAACPKGQQLATLDNHFWTTTLRLRVAAPIMTKKIHVFFVALRFSFRNRLLLLGGISPFLPPLSPERKVETELGSFTSLP